MKDSTGRYLTKALFQEFSSGGKFTPLFNLTDKDDPSTGTKSLRKLYMEYKDPHEAIFAESVFGCQEHWRKLCTAQWFLEHVEDWREDLDNLLASEGLESMKRHAKSSAPAAKWIAEKGWRGRQPAKRGRPTKDEVAGERKKQAEDEDFFRSASERLSDDFDEDL